MTMNEMQARIERAVGILVGKPLWGSNRAADMEMFQFGERVLGTDPKGRPTKHGDHSLHVQCAWRIARAGEILVGSRDVYYPRGDPMQDVPGFSGIRRV